MEKIKPPLKLLKETLDDYKTTLESATLSPEERAKLHAQVALVEAALKGVKQKNI